MKAYYDEAIWLDPQDANVWCTKGEALAPQGKHIEAILAFDEAIRLDPNLTTAWYNKGVVLVALGRTTEADAAFARARELGAD